MSRTRKGQKGAGCDLWSRRPCAGEPNTTQHRKLTIRKERAQELLALRRAKKRLSDDG